MRSPIAFVLCVTMLGAIPAEAFRLKRHLGLPFKKIHGDSTYFAGEKSFQEGSVSREVLLTGILRWNQSPGGFIFRSPLWNARNMARKNGDDEIWYSADDSLHKGKPGINLGELVWTVPPRFIENDIVLNTKTTWEYYEIRDEQQGYGRPGYPILPTLLHEMGHTMALQHATTLYNVMACCGNHLNTNGSLDGVGRARSFPGEDGGNGDVYLYGTGATQNDVGVTHWKYQKADGGYAVNIPTKVYPPGGGIDPIIPGKFNGFPVFPVDKGGTYDFQFTYENNGTQNFDGIDVGYYISTNDLITTADPKLRGITLNLYRNVPATRRTLLTLPDDLDSGNVYWVGVIVDDSKSIAEVHENNNATYLQILVN